MELIKSDNGLVALYDNGVEVVRFIGYWTIDEIASYVRAYLRNY